MYVMYVIVVRGSLEMPRLDVVTPCVTMFKYPANTTAEFNSGFVYMAFKVYTHTHNLLANYLH